MIDYKQELADLLERAQTAETPAELMEIATGLYGVGRYLDMRAVLLKARATPSLQAYPVH